MGKEALELVVELRRQRFVMRHYERRPAHLLNDLGHRVGLARPGDAKQDLVLLAIAHTSQQRLDGLALVTARFVVAD